MDLNRAWRNCIAKLEKETSAEAYTQWIKPLKAEIRGNNVVIFAHNEVVENQVRSKYLANIRSYIRSEAREGDIDKIKLARLKRSNEVPKPAAEAKRVKGFGVGLRSELTLRNFVVGPSNEDAFRAAQMVAKQPGSVSWNPLLIYGDVGLGKTHLLQAIGNEVRRRQPDLRVRYLYTAKFVSDVVYAIRHATIAKYIREFESCDFLILDDVQFFSGKEKCTEEFLHLFNYFEARNVQMVFASSTHPDAIPALNPSLKSRFNSRLTVELQSLNNDTRTNLLQYWARTSDAQWILSDENASYVAENMRGDVRNLSSFWSRLTLSSEGTRRHISKRLIDKTLRSGYTIRRSITVKQIQAIVAEHYGIALENLLSRSRRADVVRCRHMAMFITKQLTKLPLLSIADRFNRKDHTTVKHACQSVQTQLDANFDVQADYDELLEKISG